ncbi:MAG: CheR family methyltransferase [Bacteroidota bacterium]
MNAEARERSIETEVHLADVLQKIDRLLGLRYQPHQWSDLLRLLKPAARELGYSDSTSFLHWLVNGEQDEQITRVLAKHLTIGESYFFREIVVFSILRDEVLPALLAKKQAEVDRHIRIWSAGCSTGEEVYSLAILLDSVLSEKPDWKYSILGTDINPVAIERAREGRYRDWSFRDVPAEIQTSYFETLDDGRHEVASGIKGHTEFRILNLAASSALFPVGFDIVLCRNVLMYFTRDKVKSIVQGFRRSVKEEGWLIPSLTETTLINNPGFEGVRFGDATLFRKQPHIPAILTFRRDREQAKTAGDESTEAEVRGLRNPFAELISDRQFGIPSETDSVVEAPIPADPQKNSPVEIAPPAHSGGLPESGQTDRMLSDVHEHLREARLHADAGRLALALEAAEAAIARNKMNPHSHYFRGTILLEIGETSQALQAFERALYLNQDFIPAHFSIGTLHHQLGNEAKARRHLGIARQLIEMQGDMTLILEPSEINAQQMVDIIQTFID